VLKASLYIIACSSRNRMRQRLRRLREPRYLFGAIAGVAYLYFTIFVRLRASRAGGRRRGVTPASLLPALGIPVPALAGLLLLAGAAASWAMPLQSGLLEFTRPETQFLFPAPVTRRQLFIHRLLRSQIAVLFAACIMAVLYPGTSIANRLRTALGIWIFLMTCHVYFTGVTLARAHLGAGSVAIRRIAWSPLILILVAFSIVGGAAGAALWAHPATTAREALSALGGVSAHGLPRLILRPFSVLVGPFFSASWPAFGRAFGLAAAVFAIVVVWVMRTDEIFNAVSEDAVERQVDRPVRRAAAYRARPIGWTLALTGRPESAFVWKAALQTFRIVDRRVLIRFLLIVVWLTLVVALVPSARGFAQMVGVFAAIGGAFATLMAPQLLRLDLRQDLQNLELVKTWPVRAAAIVRGEIAWPAAVVTAMAWGCGALALFFSAAVFERTGIAWRMAIGIAAMILAPAIVFAQYTIHNATALLFPGWVPLGSGRPRGVDAMGQRLILLGGTWLMLLVFLLPGVLIGGVLWIAFYRFLGPWVLLPGALTCVVIVAIEVLLVTEALGPAYEQLDITSVERPE
jgi:hypothetical protein